jgi:hypothetical protein
MPSEVLLYPFKSESVKKRADVIFRDVKRRMDRKSAPHGDWRGGMRADHIFTPELNRFPSKRLVKHTT